MPKKAICKWDKKTLLDMLPLLASQIESAQFVCRKCGRAATDKRLLCKAIGLDTVANETKRDRD